MVFAQLLDSMVQICNQPNAKTSNAVLNVFCKVGNLEKAEHSFKICRRKVGEGRGTPSRDVGERL
jgi:hypothetical protein